MEVKAQVYHIDKLKDYLFLVPDYQREYVWKADEHVEQFLLDIDNEFEPGSKEQNSYFIGSIIIVKHDGKYDVIDGQQRLTTIVLTMCALRDLLENQALDTKQKQYFENIQKWLSNFNMETDEVQVRLELQYEESKDFLSQLIQGNTYSNESSASIQKMQLAYNCIKNHLSEYLQNGLPILTEYARYFLMKIELVVIESENLSSALKIFETINQRGAGLNAMDLVKNLLFSKANNVEFLKIKEKWKDISGHLQRAKEEDSPLRFLRYFLMARYHNGILREDDIYRWIISPEGKIRLNYEQKPYELAAELEKVAKRYADLVQATGLLDDGGVYPAVTRIGFINKYKSRQHLVLLLALDNNCSSIAINYLASQIESYFFFSNTLGIQTKDYERLFAHWSTHLRGLKDESSISAAVGVTLQPYLKEKFLEFKNKFLTINHSAYNPLYRLRYILGRIENTLLDKAQMPNKGLRFIDELEVEHILPQTPKNENTPIKFAANKDEYKSLISRLGNVTLLESQINKAVGRFNDLNDKWFNQKQEEYVKSSILSTNLLNNQYSIGQKTIVNKIKNLYKFNYAKWDIYDINLRQEILLELALETWKINNQRLDDISTSLI